MAEFAGNVDVPHRSASHERWRMALVLLITAAIYAQTCWFPFINYDDDVHVYHNPHVRTGLNWDNLQWAFGVHGPSQWHPLAWISHQIDASLFGTDIRGASAGGHHLVNVVLHLINVGLVFVVVRRLIRRREPALLTAALFAVHPLNVESVAWVSERRNTLCVAFVMLGLLAYLRYARSLKTWDYIAVCLWHTAALMSKPLAVSTPCLLLLLDVWPLQRWSEPEDRGGWMLITEKLPLFALSLIASVLTIFCQADAQAFQSTEALPLGVRVENALLAYVEYVRATVWPQGLAIFYPHPGLMLSDPERALFWPAVGAAALLMLITAACLLLRRRLPWLLLGWLWFLGTLLPMIGLIQVGGQQRADRYTYLPNLGLFLGIAASLPWQRLCAERWRRLSMAAASLLILALAGRAWLQTSVWRDSVTLFEDALLVDGRNHVAHLNAGLAREARGDYEMAIAHYEAALAIEPQYFMAHFSLGIVKQQLGDIPSAIDHFARAVALNPAHAESWNRLASLRSDLGEYELAIAAFEQAARLQPHNAVPRYNIGLIREHLGQHDLARTAFEQAQRADPTFAPARAKLSDGSER